MKNVMKIKVITKVTTVLNKHDDEPTSRLKPFSDMEFVTLLPSSSEERAQYRKLRIKNRTLVYVRASLMGFFAWGP